MKIEKFKVAGVTHYEDNIMSLGLKNEDYYLSNREILDGFFGDDDINEIEFDPGTVELIPEPENPHDSNAVRVEVDGVHVGYIKKGSCSHVKNLLSSPDFREVRVESMGIGRYKRIWEDEDGGRHVEKCERYPWVHIEILTGKEQLKINNEPAESITINEPKETKKQSNNNNMGGFYFVIGIVLYVLSFLLIVVYPLPAFAFSLISVGMIYYGAWLRNKKQHLDKTFWVFILMGISFVLFLTVMI